MRGPDAELAAKSDHQRVDHSGGDFSFLVLNAGDDLGVRVNTAGPTDETVQELELAARQRQLPFAHDELESDITPPYLANRPEPRALEHDPDHRANADTV